MTAEHAHAPKKSPRAAGETDAMIRVNHAGEYGAVRIYEGQLAVLGATHHAAALRHMLAQEKEHFKAFDAMMRRRGVRPTVFQPLWRVAGYALGAATAVLGAPSAMACTVAVEDVIDDHYAEQQRKLKDGDPELKTIVDRFRADEQEHRDEALRRKAEDAPFYPLLAAAIKKTLSRLAIWLSSRL